VIYENKIIMTLYILLELMKQCFERLIYELEGSFKDDVQLKTKVKGRSTVSNQLLNHRK